MNILQEVADKVTRAIDTVVEANRRTALINRIKLVVRNEEKNIERSYAALGRYYYNTLRDKSNGETEPYCAALERSKKRLERATAKLEELTSPREPILELDGCDSECGSDCDAECDECPFVEDFDSAASPENLMSIDIVVDGDLDEDDFCAQEHPEFLRRNRVDSHEEGEAAGPDDSGRIPSGDV